MIGLAGGMALLWLLLRTLRLGMASPFRRRAAQWYERNREPEEALEYWMKAAEVDSAARLVGALAFPAY